MRNLTCLFFALCVSLAILQAEELPNGLGQDVPRPKVDQVFADYDKPGSPGCSLGVIRDGMILEPAGFLPAAGVRIVR